jgi:phenylalanyl-tRNA synthetase alpha subunit
MIIKLKPKQPDKNLTNSIEINNHDLGVFSGMTISDIFIAIKKYLKSLNYTDEELTYLKYDDIKVYLKYSATITFMFDIPISKVNYDSQVEKFNTKMKNYNKWYNENKDKIELELENRTKRNNERKIINKHIYELKSQLNQLN